MTEYKDHHTNDEEAGPKTTDEWTQTGEVQTGFAIVGLTVQPNKSTTQLTSKF